MDLNFTAQIHTICVDALNEYVNVRLIYYTHIPAAIISLFVGLFVFLKKRDLIGKILFSLSILFSSFIVLNLITWLSTNEVQLMFFWSFFGVVISFIFILCLYFSYLFFFYKDLSPKIKFIVLLFLLPIFLVTPTRFAMDYFDSVQCMPIENIYFMYYYYFFGILSSVGVIILLIKRNLKILDKTEKRKNVLFTVGIEFFILMLFFASFLASYLFDNGLVSSYNLEPYGLFGSIIFMAFLAYLIVKFKAFNIKLIGAQALVTAVVILIGSQFFFIQNNTNRILTGITLTLVVVFGWWLVKSVKQEIKRKEELEIVNITLINNRNELEKKKTQLEKASSELKDVNLQLKHANEHLQTLDKAKSEFMSITSHQLRTPLTGIMGYLSMVLEGDYGKMKPNQAQILKEVFEASQRLIRMVNLFLNVTRIEAGRFNFFWQETDMYELIKDQVHEMLPPAEKKRLALSIVEKPKNLPKVMVDHDKIKDVILNLIDNAIKYTQKGGIKVSIMKKGKDQVEMIVKDTGVGIEPREAEKLFEKFTRGDGMAKINPNGAGLGLFIAKKMVEGHHGKIWVESKGAGKGSEFHVILPVKQV